MSSKIKEIIFFFSHHDTSETTKKRVWQYMVDNGADSEANGAYKELWEESGNSDIDDVKTKEAFRRISNTIIIDNDNRKRHIATLWWSRIAAVLIPLLAIVSIVAFYKAKQQEDFAGNVSLIQKQALPRDTAIVMLPDGSNVKLSDGSTLLYPSSFGSGNRKVYLVGKATLNVQHDKANPITVVTPYFEITDLGTVFDITSYPDAEESSATVSSGRIMLRVKGSSQTYNMSRNDMLVFNVSTGKVLTGKKEDLSKKWKRSQVNLDDIRFADAADILSKNYGVTMDIRNHKYDSMRVTVHFFTGETLETTMRVIASMLPDMRYEITSNKVIIR